MQKDLFKPAMKGGGRMENKFTKPFHGDSCPKCGGGLIVKTDCDPSKDDDFTIWYRDGDEVYCDECDFKSCLSVDEDSVYVQDTDYDD